jgi:hypothetical protein
MLMGWLLIDVLAREAGRRTGQPTVDDRFLQGSAGDGIQLDENGGVAVEVRDREESQPQVSGHLAEQ